MNIKLATSWVKNILWPFIKKHIWWILIAVVVYFLFSIKFSGCGNTYTENKIEALQHKIDSINAVNITYRQKDSLLGIEAAYWRGVAGKLEYQVDVIVERNRVFNAKIRYNEWKIRSSDFTSDSSLLQLQSEYSTGNRLK